MRILYELSWLWETLVIVLAAAAVCVVCAMLICKAGDEEGGLYAEVDLKESSDLRNKKPYTQLRRTEDYL